MAARSYEAGFRKYYGDRVTNISDDTSDEQIKQVCDHWARDYDKVIKMYQIKSRLYRGPNDNFRKNICSEDDLRSRIFETDRKSVV